MTPEIAADPLSVSGAQTDGGASSRAPAAKHRPLPPGATGHEQFLDLFFSLKTFFAAILAYYIALRIGLDRPYWSVITCYIVAQPLTGALLSKGIFRLVGTAVGATVAVILVPNLVNAPELLSLALALWLGICTYVAVLDRTPRSYVALLAGYSAIIVAFPSVDTPGAIFDVAALRAQEIGIGIACVSFVHALVFPRPVWRQLRDRLDGILADARTWSLDALAVPNEQDIVLRQDQHRLASDLHDLHLLSTHLPYDMAATSFQPVILRTMETELALMLPLASAVEDRIAALRRADGYSAPVQTLVQDVRKWIEDEAPGDGAALIDRARTLEPALVGPAGLQPLLRLSLLDRLAQLVRAHAMARSLRNRLIRGHGVNRSDPGYRVERPRKRSLHRDRAVALRAAISTTLTVLIGCGFWIATAWPDGGTAVVAATIICALFSHLDAPGRAAWRVFAGTLGASVAAALCAFAIMPRATAFETLCLALFVPLLGLGWLLARPARAPYGVGAVLAFPGLAGLGAVYGDDFGRFANQAIAQILGSLLACLILGAVRGTGSRRSIRRLRQAAWRDLARKTQMTPEPDTHGWISRMLDRMVLLGPHLRDEQDGREKNYDAMRHVRIGMALDDLQHVGKNAGARQAKRNGLLLARLRGQFEAAQRTGVLEVAPSLPSTIDRAIRKADLLPDSPAKRSLLLALVGLRRNLSPTS